MRTAVAQATSTAAGGLDPDRAHVSLAQAGDSAAFTELVSRHQRRIVNLVRAMTGGDGDAEDVAQEVFLRAYRALDKFRGDSAFGTWLHAVAVNVVKTHAVRRTKDRQRRGNWPTTPEGELVDPHDERAADPERSAVLRDAIDRALGELPEELRSVLVLRDVQGLDYKEIAAALGVPIGTVESRLFRARQRLRPLLEPVITGKA